jgi:hypothetical protein
MSFASFSTSASSGKNGLLNQSVSASMNIDVQTRGNSSTFIGYNTPTAMSGSSNTIIGYQAGLTATGMNDLILLGANAGMSNRTSGNIGIGNRSLQYNQFGYNLLSIGNDSSSCNEDGYSPVYNNTFIGHCTGKRAIGYENIFIGMSNNATASTLRTYNNVSVGNYSRLYGSNSVQVGFSNLLYGDKSISVGTYIQDFNSNNIIVGRDIINYGSNCIILKSSHKGIYQNYQNNYINIQDIIIGSNTASGKYVLKLQTDSITLETSDGQTTTLGGNSNSVNAASYTITANVFNVNANSTFSSPTIFNGQLTANADMTVNGITTFNSPVIFNSPQLTFTSVMNLLSNVNIKGQLQVFDQSYFKDQANFLTTTNFQGTANFSNGINVSGDIVAQRDLMVQNDLYVLNGTGTFCNDVRVLGSTSMHGFVNVAGDAVFELNTQVDGNMTVLGVTSLSNMNAMGTSHFGSDVHMDGNLQVDGTGTFTDIVIRNPLFSLSNNVTIHGTTQLNSLTTTGIASFCNLTFFNAPVAFSGPAIFASNITCAATATLCNAYVSGDTRLNDVTIDGKLTLKTPLTLSNTVYNYGDTYNYGQTHFYNTATSYSVLRTVSNLVADGPLQVNAGALFSGQASFNNSVSFCNSITSYGPFVQHGTTTLSNTTYAFGQFVLSNSLYSYGQSTFAGHVFVDQATVAAMEVRNLVVDDSALMNGNVCLAGRTTFCNTAQFTGACAFDNYSTFNSNAFFARSFTSNATIDDLTTANLKANGNACFSGGIATFSNSTILSGTNTVYGTTDFNNQVNFNCNINVQNIHTAHGTFDSLDIRSNLTVEGSVIAKGPVTFCNDVVMLQGLFQNGNTTFNDIVSFNDSTTFDSMATFRSNMTAYGQVAVQGGIQVAGNAGFAQEVLVMGSAAFSNAVTVAGTLTQRGDAVFQGDAEFLRGVSASSLQVTNAASFAGQVALQSNVAIMGSLACYGVSTFSNTATFCAPVYAIGNANYFGTVSMCNANVDILSASGPAHFLNDISIYGKSYLSNDVVVKGDIEVVGTFNTSNNATFSGPVLFQNNTVAAGGILTSNIEVQHSAKFDDSVMIDSNLTVSGTSAFHNGVTMDSNLDIAGSLVVSKDLIVKGQVTYCNFVVLQGSQIELGDATFVGRTTFCNTADFLDSVTIARNLATDSLQASGNATMNSNLTVGNALDVWGHTHLHAALNVNSNLVVLGATQLERTLNVYGVATFSNDIFIDGNMSSTGNSWFLGLTGFSNRVYFASNVEFNDQISTRKLIVQDIATFASAQIDQELVVQGVAAFSNGVTVKGSLTTEGSATFDGALVANGGLGVYGNIDAHSSLSVSCNMGVQGSVQVNQGLEVMGPASFSNGVEFGNDIIVQGSLSTTGAANFAGRVAMTNDLVLAGSTHVSGPFSIDESNLIVSGTNFASYIQNIADQMSVFSSCNATFNGDLTIASNLTARYASISNLDISGNLQVNGVNFDRYVESLSQDPVFSGILIGDVGTFSNLRISSDLEIDGTLYVSGSNIKNFIHDISINSISSASNIDVNGTLNLRSDLDVAGTVNIDLSNLLLSGSNLETHIRNIIGIGSCNTTFNGLTYMSNLNVGGSLFISGCNINDYINSIVDAKTSFGSSNTTFTGIVNVSGDAVFNSNIIGATAMLSNVYVGSNMTVAGTLNVDGSNLVVSGSNFFDHIKRLTASNIASNLTLDSLTVNSNVILRGGVHFVDSNDVFIGGCNLMNYLSKIATLTTTSNISDMSQIDSIVINTSTLNVSHLNSIVGDLGTATIGSLAVNNIASFGRSNVFIGGCNLGYYLDKINTLDNLPTTTNTSNITACNGSFQSLDIGGCNLANYLNVISGITGGDGTLNAATLSANTVDTMNLNTSYMFSSNGYIQIGVFDSITVNETAHINHGSFETLSVSCNVAFGASNVTVGDCNLAWYLSKISSGVFDTLDVSSNIYIAGCNLESYIQKFLPSNSYSPVGVFDSLVVNGCNFSYYLEKLNSLSNTQTVPQECCGVINTHTITAVDAVFDNVIINSNTIIGNCNLSYYIAKLEGLNSTFVGGSVDSIDVLNLATFGQSNVIIGGCNLGHYLHKLETIGADSNHISVDLIESDTINTVFANATNLNTTNLNTTNLNTTNLNTTNLNATNVFSSNTYAQHGVFDSLQVSSNASFQKGMFDTIDVMSNASFGQSNVFVGGCNLGYYLDKINGIESGSNSLKVAALIADNIFTSDLTASNGSFQSGVFETITVNGTGIIETLEISSNASFGQSNVFIGGCNLSFFLEKVSSLDERIVTDMADVGGLQVRSNAYFGVSNLFLDGCNIGYYLESMAKNNAANEFVGNLDVASNLHVHGHIVCDQYATFSNEISVGGDASLYSDLFVNGNSYLTNLNVVGISTFCNSAYFEQDVFMSEMSTFIDGCNLFYYLSKLRGIGSLNALENSNVCAMSNLIIETAMTTLPESVYVESNMVIGGNLIVQGSCCLDNVLLTNISATNLSVDGVNSTGPSMFQDSVMFEGPTSFNAPSRFDSELVANGPITFSNTTTLYGALNAHGQSTFVDLLVQNNLVVGQDTSLLNLSVSNDAVFAGSVSASHIVSDQGLVIDADVFANSNLVVHEDLSVSGVATFSNDAVFAGSVSASHIVSDQGLVIDADVFANSNLSVSGVATLVDLIVSGQASFSNHMTMYGTMRVEHNAAFGADLVVFGNTTLCNNLVVGGTILSSSNTLTTGGLAVLGDSEIQGVLTSADIRVRAITVGGMSVFEEMAYFHDGLFAECNLIAMGPATLCNTLDVAGDIVCACNLTVLGHSELQATEFSGVASFCNDTYFNENVYMHELSTYIDGCNLSYFLTKLRNHEKFLVIGSQSNWETFSNDVYSHAFNTLEESVLVGSNLIVGNDLIVNGTIYGMKLDLQTDALEVVSVSAHDIIVDNTLKIASSNTDWSMFVQESNFGSELVFRSFEDTHIAFTNEFESGVFNFTGSHRCAYSNIQEDESMIGRIVVSTGAYNNLENTSQITINEAVPVVELATQSMDKRVFGVIAGFEEHPALDRTFKIGNIRFNTSKTVEDRKIIVNSLGEGAIKVCDLNGNFENGDLITTCDVAGFGVRQGDDLVHNYTLAKITTDVDWEQAHTRFTCGTEIHGQSTVKWALVGCVYLC